MNIIICGWLHIKKNNEVYEYLQFLNEIFLMSNFTDQETSRKN